MGWCNGYLFKPHILPPLVSEKNCSRRPDIPQEMMGFRPRAEYSARISYTNSPEPLFAS